MLISRPTPFLALLAGALLLLSACDNALELDASAATEADLTLASEVVAQALSDADDGTMADLNDLNASVGAEGLVYGEGAVARSGGLAHRAWHRPNKRHRATYDSTTGEHTIEYQRAFTSPRYSKELDVRLVYVFTDADGRFIARPRAQAATIDAIAFEGARAGFSRSERPGSHREAHFTRTATWTATDVQSGTVAFAGTQQDAGVLTVVRGDSTVERAYEATLRSQDVVVTRADAGAGLEAAVTGRLLYTVTLRRTGGGRTEEKRVEGTLELEGNGRALLRFMGTRQLYQIDLRDGTVSRRG